jgi:REP element-mobilizing transposase RayT
MPRSARLDAPGVLHHIIIRGIERRKIFIDNNDREEFMVRLEKLLPVTKTSCYAWALIPNHAHFLFRAGDIPIATLMRRLLTGYAVYFNRRHKRSGQLFQNRYKSILCQEDAYLLELVRYVHLNPLRAGLVKSLEELNGYPYCGQSVLMKNKNRDWQNADYVLSYFGKQSNRARKHYCAFVSEGIQQGQRDDLIGGGLIRSLGGWSAISRNDIMNAHHKSDERILGDSDFVDSLLSAAEEKIERYYNVRRSGYDLDKVAERAASLCFATVEDIYSKSRRKINVKARSLFCYWASRELGVPLTELARQLGITVPAVSYSVARGEVIVQTNHYQLIKG